MLDILVSVALFLFRLVVLDVVFVLHVLHLVNVLAMCLILDASLALYRA